MLKKDATSLLNNNQLGFLNGGGNTVKCACAGVATCAQNCNTTKTTTSKGYNGCTTLTTAPTDPALYGPGGGSPFNTFNECSA